MSELIFQIRSATAADEVTIKAMISHAQLDPSNIHWENFLLAEHEGKIVSIGQLKPYPDCTELGSLVTLREYRGHGLASRIIAALEARAKFPLYLLCRDRMGSFYQKFGYQTISWREAPNSLKLKLSFAALFRIFGVKVLVMKKPSA